MNRLLPIKQYADRTLEEIPLEEARYRAFLHSYGVAQCCALLAGRRGLNMELAYISGLLHDLYAYKLGSYTCHSQSGAEMIRVTLKRSTGFTEDEKLLILSAIFHHDDILYIHGAYDEVLKDADILQPYLNDPLAGVSSLRKLRLQGLFKELRMDHKPVEFLPSKEEQEQFTGRRAALADIAEALAGKQVQGISSDNDFMEIIKYYPEASAFDELQYRWCGAFVYHCCRMAGIDLPLRPLPATVRLAGVKAWYEWGEHNGFCGYEEEGFLPERGDILIYNNIIPPENKEKNSPWHDHIGILLAVCRDRVIVAEGNVDNKNVSGITVRSHDSSIGCFVRIPEDYQYNGVNYDYKTGGLQEPQLYKPV